MAYIWDRENQKKVYKGKYAGSLNGSEYDDENDVNKHQLVPRHARNKREFIGSRIEEYTFSNYKRGTRTISATSFKEALRIAKSLGFTRGDYKER